MSVDEETVSPNFVFALQHYKKEKHRHYKLCVPEVLGNQH